MSDPTPKTAASPEPPAGEAAPECFAADRDRCDHLIAPGQLYTVTDQDRGPAVSLIACAAHLSVAVRVVARHSSVLVTAIP